jgi:hypothetical protein
VLTDYLEEARSDHTTRIPDLSLHRKVSGSVIWPLPTLGAQEPCREYEADQRLKTLVVCQLEF